MVYSSREENELNNDIAFLNETLCYIRHKRDFLYEKRKIVKFRLKNFYTLTNSYLKQSEEEELTRVNEEISYFNKKMRDTYDEIDELYERKKCILNKMGDDK